MCEPVNVKIVAEGGVKESKKKKGVDYTGHKETPTTRASPFIVHNTSLFTLRSESVQVVYSVQIIATEALDKKTTEIFAGWFPAPSSRFREGRERRGRRREQQYSTGKCMMRHLQSTLLKGRLRVTGNIRVKPQSN